MQWIQLENKMFLKESVVGLEFAPGSEQIIATLIVHLSNGSQLKLIREEANKVWEIFNREVGSV